MTGKGVGALKSIIVAFILICSTFSFAQDLEVDDRDPTLESLTNGLREIFSASSSSDPRLLSGLESFLNGDSKKALREFKSVLADSENDGSALHAIGAVYYHNSRWNQAKKFYSKIIELNNNDYHALLRLGIIAILQSDFSDAETFLTGAVEARENNKEALLQLGKLYAIREDSPAQAILNLRKSYSGFADDVELNVELGDLYYKKESFKEAEYFYSRATKLDKKNDKYRLLLAKSLFYQGDLTTALKSLKKIIKNDKRHIEANFYLGAILLEQKKLGRSITTLEKVERLAPGKTDSLFYLARAKRQTGLRQEAIKDLIHFRIFLIEKSAEHDEIYEKSTDLMLEIEGELKIERFTHQLPGGKSRMTLIPRGQTIISTSSEVSEALRGDIVDVTSFWIDTFEVSNADYKKFVRSSGWKAPRCDDSYRMSKKLCWTADGSFPEGQSNLPVVNVSQEDAKAYAAWLGKRLPSEQEWQVAAAVGNQKSFYPWGNDIPNSKQARFGESELPRPVSEGEKNGFGLVNIVGNAAEWCADPHRNDDDKDTGYVYKGGHWRSGAEELRIHSRYLFPKETRSAFVGFRCAAKALTAKGKVK